MSCTKHIAFCYSMCLRVYNVHYPLSIAIPYVTLHICLFFVSRVSSCSYIPYYTIYHSLSIPSDRQFTDTQQNSTLCQTVCFFVYTKLIHKPTLYEANARFFGFPHARMPTRAHARSQFFIPIFLGMSQ